MPGPRSETKRRTGSGKGVMRDGIPDRPIRRKRGIRLINCDGSRIRDVDIEPDILSSRWDPDDTLVSTLRQGDGPLSDSVHNFVGRLQHDTLRQQAQSPQRSQSKPTRLDGGYWPVVRWTQSRE